MSQQSDKPVEGDTYHCEECEMSLLITTSCNCDTDDGAFFTCCGQQMKKSPKKS
ncbi:hypothetical protein ACUNV4_23910 [Granulosicoccus sp. 3-233]|uniref:hypothetical protein n=1 Tax=Granulosicoccus sp. 3-233 TaxID=3417969 RepID=UPI003D3289BE